MTGRRKRIENRLREFLNIPSRSHTPAPRSAAVPTNQNTGSVGSSNQVQNLQVPVHLPTQTSPDPTEQAEPGPIPNPIPPAEAGGKSKPSWVGLKKLLDTLQRNSNFLGPFKSVVEGLAVCMELLDSESGDYEEYEQLKSEMDSLCMSLSAHLNDLSTSATTSSVMNLVNDIGQQVQFLVTKKDHRNQLSRYEAATKTTEVLIVAYRRINWLLNRMNMNLNMEMWKKLDEIETDRRLNQLPNSAEARYRATREDGLRREVCTPNTRVEILSTIQSWANNTESERIYWLNGMAGTGKTTIASSICDYLEQIQRLAGSFFCSRQSPACRDVNRIIPSISYQLAIFSRPFRCALSRVLEQDSEAYNQSIAQQFTKLLADPLREIQGALPDNLIVVVDALDECTNTNGTSEILNVLISRAQELPLRFFIASRPEPQIIDKMKKADEKIELRLHDLDRQIVNQDIREYLSDRLGPANLSSSDLETLTIRSGALFIYAATVVRYLGFDNFSRYASRLSHILSSSSGSQNSSNEGTDELYTQILEAAFTQDGLQEDENKEMEMILQTVIYAQQPLTIRAIAGLLDLDEKHSVVPSLRHFLSVLRVGESDGLITTLHESFPDYMLDRRRSNRFWRDPEVQHGRLVEQCIDKLMSSRISFHVCQPGPSHLLHYGAGDGYQIVENALSSGLAYACSYWADHLEHVYSSESLVDTLYSMITNRLLSWIEVLNLIKRIHLGDPAMLKLRDWYIKTNCLDNSPSLNDYYNSFGNAYLLLSKYSDNIKSLDSSIMLCSRAIALTSEEHPDMPLYLNNLGQAYSMRSKSTGDPDQSKKAITYLNKAAKLCPMSHSRRPYILQNCAGAHQELCRTSKEFDGRKIAIELQEQAVELLPDDHPDKAEFLWTLGNHYLRRHGELALEALRVYKRAAEIPTGCPYYRLQASIACARISEAYRRLHGDPIEACCLGFRVLPMVIQQHAYGEQDSLAVIMKDFTGRAVALAISAQKSSITGSSNCGRKVTPTLPKLETYKEVLGYLWSVIVRPVLDSLGIISDLPPSNNLPHIIWCPSGLLAFASLHASGDYSKPDSILSNYAVTSYTPNLSCLIRSNLPSVPFSRILAVGYDLNKLSKARSELDLIQQRFGNHRCTRLEEENARPEAVLEALDNCQWVHFVCRAGRVLSNPLKSGLLLHDRCLDLASIIKSPIKGGQLVYLSACDTATAHPDLPNEALHLAAGFINKGYSSVVATRHSITEDDAVLVSSKFYQYMLEDGVPDHRKAAIALHKAVAHLRECVGVEEYGRWVPFVHYGY
ncbi:CHAT domain protein [Ceratobasidium sp. AG-Ba]|nr:CHAT domain protein [Ceratobasidium sp. AG-Ba]